MFTKEELRVIAKLAKKEEVVAVSRVYRDRLNSIASVAKDEIKVISIEEAKDSTQIIMF